jgi:hypothetical protein
MPGYRFRWVERVVTGWNGPGEWATPIIREDQLIGTLLQFVVDGQITRALMLDDKTGTVFAVPYTELTVIHEQNL